MTLNEINVMGMGSYLLGMFPPGRSLAVPDMTRAFDNLLAAHVAAYDVLHRLQPDATVTTNNASVSVYELDRMLIDLLLMRRAGVAPGDVGTYLSERRASWYAALPAPDPVEKMLRRWGRRASKDPADAFRTTLEAVWSSPHEVTLDVIGIDYYDPVASHHVRIPGTRTAGGRSWAPGRELWDDLVDPSGLARYCRANATEGLDLWMVENGMCNRVRRGRSYPRLDGWDRIRYLRENLTALVRRHRRRGTARRLLPLDPGRQLRVGELRAALRDPRSRSRAGRARPGHRRHGGRRRRCLPVDHRRSASGRPLRDRGNRLKTP